MDNVFGCARCGKNAAENKDSPPSDYRCLRSAVAGSLVAQNYVKKTRHFLSLPLDPIPPTLYGEEITKPVPSLLAALVEAEHNVCDILFKKSSYRHRLRGC